MSELAKASRAGVLAGGRAMGDASESWGTPSLAALALGAAPAGTGPLARCPRLTMRDGYRGAMQFGGRRAQVVMESEDRILVRWKLRGRVAAEVCPLSLSHRLGGNARLALGRRGAVVLADTRCNGQAHLDETFGEIARALRLVAAVADGKETAVDGGDEVAAATVPAETIERVVADLPWDGEAVVRLEGSWELRPRLAGEAVPVVLKPVGRDLQVTRVVLSHVPTGRGSGRAAVLDHAARTNARLWGARLALAGDHLVAETRLHPGQFDGGWLAEAAYAVTAAARLARVGLRVLAEQPVVARRYEEMFGIVPSGFAEGSAEG